MEDDSKSAEDKPESSHKPYPRSAWENWCNAKYAGTKKAPMDIDGQPPVSIKHVDSAPISDFDCKSKVEIENTILQWQSWARTQKLLYKDKVSRSDIALRITWGFVGNLNFW